VLSNQSYRTPYEAAMDECGIKMFSGYQLSQLVREVVPETSVIFNQVTRLIAREHFIDFSRRESLRFYSGRTLTGRGGRKKHVEKPSSGPLQHELHMKSPGCKRDALRREASA
jgi:hypothetical protein